MTANTPSTRRAKGKEFEREISQDLRESDLDKTARRMPCSGALEDLKADIVTQLPVHFECKRQEKVNLDEAYNQALTGKKQQEMAIVVTKKSRKDPMAYLSWKDLIYLMQLAKQGGWVQELLYSKRRQVNK